MSARSICRPEDCFMVNEEQVQQEEQTLPAQILQLCENSDAEDMSRKKDSPVCCNS